MKLSSKTIAVIDEIKSNAINNKRYIISISGAPGCGKSTFSKILKKQLNSSEIIQMDGFHLENKILIERGIINKKGSPETFDVEGLISLIERIKNNETSSIYAPIFNRAFDSSIGSAVEIKHDIKFIIVEGNYLILNKYPWNILNDSFDYNIFIDCDESILEKRLMNRWVKLGFSLEKSKAKTVENDMKNRQTIINNLLDYDVNIEAESDFNE